MANIFIDNVDVGGIEVAPSANADFITGILNCAVVEFCLEADRKAYFRMAICLPTSNS